MTELLSLTPLEYILIGLVALGIFLFFRACWHNIQQSSRSSSARLLPKGRKKAFTAKSDRDTDTSPET